MQIAFFRQASTNAGVFALLGSIMSCSHCSHKLVCASA